jgi:hypothetical protein
VDKQHIPPWLVLDYGEGFRIRCERCGGTLVMTRAPLTLIDDLVSLATRAHERCKVQADPVRDQNPAEVGGDKSDDRR